MIVILALVVGLFWGWQTARRRGGNTYDRIQYALVHAILFGIVGLVVTILIGRLAPLWA